PDYIKKIAPEKLNIEDQQKAKLPSPVKWLTLYITGGRRDKISKGDIAGLFLKQGQIQKHQLGVIELKQNCAYAGVHAEIAEMLIEKTNNSKLKKKKVRISLI
ncbi:MAG: ATP-dependent helicase, partial [Bacteroidetes bacterium]|nr:ATP-dependent helicase [Bacteroidota bacterium]